MGLYERQYRACTALRCSANIVGIQARENGVGQRMMPDAECPQARLERHATVTVPCSQMMTDSVVDKSRLAAFANASGARYRSDIVAGALMLPESRIIAEFVLRGDDGAALTEAVVGNNLLMMRGKSRAMRVTRLIRDRLQVLPLELVRLVRDGSGDIATFALLAGVIKQSPLFGDFLALTVDDQFQQFSSSLSNRLWDEYVEGCRARDPLMAQWNEQFRARLRSSVFQTLAQAGYLENTRTLKLQPVHVPAVVLQCLAENRENYVLRCIQVGS